MTSSHHSSGSTERSRVPRPFGRLAPRVSEARAGVPCRPKDGRKDTALHLMYIGKVTQQNSVARALNRSERAGGDDGVSDVRGPDCLLHGQLGGQALHRARGDGAGDTDGL